MKRRTVLMSAIVLGAALISSCSFGGLFSRSEADAATAAGALLDYVASESYEQMDELDVTADAFELTGAGGGSASLTREVTTATVTREYPGVIWTIERSVDDNGTATHVDDVVTVTRTGDFGSESPDRIQEIVRPRRPGADSEWESYGDPPVGWMEDPENQIVQTGTTSRLLGEVEVASGEVTATWILDGSTVYASRIETETSNVVRTNVVHRTIMTQTGPDTDRSLVRERVVDDEVVYRYRVEPYVDPDDGETYPRITREDAEGTSAGYAIVRARGNRRGDPREVEYYTNEDVLVLTTEDVITAATGQVESTRTFYDESGAVTDTRVVTYSLVYDEDDEDTVTVTRTGDNGRTRTVTITESGEVYVVTLRGETYRMRVVDAATVELLDDAGNVVMTVERAQNGSWIVTQGGEQVTVS